ncbi:MAG: hypothetical protein ABIG44_13885 [Planctomycetota bacterium]
MSIPNSHLDGKTFAIGVLSITACVLFVGFLLISISPTPAYAIGMNDRSGDYIMLTQQLTNSSEGLIIADAASKRLIVYSFDPNRKQIVILSGIPLDRLREPEPDPADQPNRGRRP